MKKAISLIMAFIIFSACGISVHGEKSESTYNISVIKLSESDDAKELNKYRKALVRHINISYARNQKRIEKYSFYFDDPDTCYGVMDSGIYYNMKKDVSYDDFINSLSRGPVGYTCASTGYPNTWHIMIMFDAGLYDAEIYKAKKPRSRAHDYNLGGDWYIENEFFTSITNSGSFEKAEKEWNERNDYVTKISEALSAVNEPVKDVQVYRCTFSDRSYAQGYVIFVNGTAKYFYTPGVYLQSNKYTEPYFPVTEDDFKEGTPQDVKDKLVKYSAKYWCNYRQDLPSVNNDGWHLLKYNTVISWIKAYIKYFDPYA